MLIDASNFDRFSYIAPYIRYCAEDIYHTKWILKNRKIGDHEIILVTNGEGCFTIRDCEYKVTKNDLLSIKPNEWHSAFSTTSHFSFLCIHFDLYISDLINNVFLDEKIVYESAPAGELKYYKAALEMPDYIPIAVSSPIEACLRKIQIESRDREVGFITITKSLFLELLFNLFRQIDNVFVDDFTSSQVHEIILFIKKNYMHKITLSDIAKHVHLQSTYVSSLFSKTTGQTVTHFINNYRLIVAKEMLVNTKYKISHIANITGFYDIHHFTSAFKRFEGLPPGKYRKTIT